MADSTEALRHEEIDPSQTSSMSAKACRFIIDTASGTR